MTTPSHLIHGADIAAFALKYQGTPYVWGGYNTAGWDCSGFVNFVLGKHFGMTLPGGFKWNGNWHGPTAAMYKVWGKSHNVASAEAGDLCVWATHIGIALGGGKMISALDPALGTAVTGIAGPGNEKLTIRRINIVAATAPSGRQNQDQSGGCALVPFMLPWLIVKGVITRARYLREAAC